uniref:Uncharacterized protein n=1 Tax=Rhizophora mucronata TaxID=61149 RepID=A0A2P2QCT4_RHIMU
MQWRRSFIWVLYVKSQLHQSHGNFGWLCLKMAIMTPGLVCVLRMVKRYHLLVQESFLALEMGV